MEMKAVVFGDKAVQVAATDADTVTAHITALDKKVGELTAKLADAESKVLTDAQIQEKAKAIADAMGRREKVKAKLGDAADKMSDAQIEGALAVIDAVPGADDTARNVLGDAMKVKEDNPMEAFYKKKEAKK
jgi:chemotaxis regulatin CheY-phosphate phosphatase CheZ